MTIIDDDPVILETVGGVANVTICRPRVLNSLNSDVLYSIIMVLSRIESNPDARVVVIRGEGTKSFVAGADITQMNQLGARAIADYVELGQRAMRRIESFPLPVIAAVNGYALGGGLELALACDIIVAVREAKLGQPEVNLGIIPGFGGTQRLVERCGIGFAKYLVMSGELIDAETARSARLVEMVYSAEEFESKVKMLADNLAKKAPLAVKAGKRVVRAYAEQQIMSGLRHEAEEFLRLFGSVDREEGMNAFLQKRAPTFFGR